MDEKLRDVLECLRRHRLTVCTFLEAYFACDTHFAKISRAIFFKHHGMARVFQALLDNSDYALSKRQTTARNKQLYDDFGPYFSTIITRMLRLEVIAVGKDPLMHMRPQDVSPQLCEEFNLQKYEKLYLEKAPIFFGLLRILCCVDTSMQPLRMQPIGEPLTPEELEEEMEEALDHREGATQPDMVASDSENDQVPGDDISEHTEHVSHGQKRKPRPKGMMSIMAMSIIMASRSQRNNGITGRMGIFMRAMKVPKRMHTFLAACGLCNAYDTSTYWLKENASSDRVALANKFQVSPMAVCWDNLVRFDRKAEETVLNQGSKIQQNTSALVLPLYLPPPPAGASEEEIDTYANVMAACAKKGVGLPRDLLFHDINYSSLNVTAADFLELEALKAHTPKIAGEFVVEVLSMMCGEALKEYQLGGRSIKWDSPTLSYLQLDQYNPQFHTCPTMPVDETTIDGTGVVVETLLEYAGTSPGQLTDENRVLFCYGDQLTLKNLSALKEMRVREADTDRFTFAVGKPGFLHASMAMVNAVMRCNWGHTTGGRDPSCLSRFAAILGRSRANKTVSDFQASYRLIDHVLRGYVAAALMSRVSLLAGEEINSVADLKRWVKVNDWWTLVNSVVDYYFRFGKVAWQRKMASEKVLAEYEVQRERILAKRKANRNQEEVNFTKESGKSAFLRQHTLAERDKVLENAILFMTQALVAVDFQQSMRSGSVGRLEMDIKLMLLCFHGCGKSKYAQLLLERAFDQKYLWTAEHHYIDIRNNVICTGRRFTGIDECLEHVNRDISDSYNPRDTWQSEKFHREVVSPNVVPFRKMKHSVFKSSDMTTGGIQHTCPKPNNDILLVMNTLLREKILTPKPGRCSVGPGGAKVGVRETVDMFDIGSEKVMYGGAVEAILVSRQRKPAAPYVPDVDQDRWIEVLERAVDEWNTEVAVQRDNGSQMEVHGNDNDECGN